MASAYCIGSRFFGSSSSSLESKLNLQSRLAYLVAAYLVGLCGSNAMAASFNCESKLSGVEAMICRDDALSGLDDKLLVRYRERLATVEDPQALIGEQRNWLRQRTACVDQSCVAKAYHERLGQLDSARPISRPIRAHSEDICSKVAQDFNGNSLIAIVSSEDRLNGYLRLDLNGDGREELVGINPAGRFESASLSIRNEHNEEILPDYGDFAELGEGGVTSIVRVERRLYELRRESRRLIALVSFDEKFKGRALCEFTLSSGSGGNPSKFVNRALTPFELVIARSKRKRYGNPYHYAVELKDPGMVRLLYEGGEPINGHSGSRGLDAPLAYAVWKYEDDDKDGLRVVEQLLKLGADPDERQKESTSAMDMAFTNQKAKLVDLMLSYSKTVKNSNVEDIIGWKIPEEIKSRYLMRYAQVQGNIDFVILKHALTKNPPLLEQIARSSLPYVADYENYLNGRPVNMPEWVMYGVKRLPDIKLRTALLAKPSVIHSRGSLGHFSGFERPGRFVLVKTGLRSRNSDTSFAVNICLHLLGGDCGDEATVKAARAWFEGLPKDCPANVKAVYDNIVCRLAVEYARAQANQIFSAPDGSGALDFVQSIQVLGVRSVENRGWLRW
jgi:uncharacterized protein